MDTRFYQALGPLTAGALADGRTIIGRADALVSEPSAFGKAGPQSLSYWDNPKQAPPDGPPLGVCIVRPRTSLPLGRAQAWIEDPEPRACFARLASRLAVERGCGAAPDAIAPSARIETGAVLGPGVVIGEGAEIGAGVRLGPGVVIGPGVTIGRNSQIGPRAVIQFALLGDGVRVLAVAVIGEAGFGVATDAAGLVDIPHFGRVIVMDRASIGANSAVDRGLFDDTIIGEEAKIDNLCHVGHNCIIGRRVRMAAFAGISGSTTIADDALLGGRVGIADHRHIGVRSVLAAGSAVMHDVPDGEVWGGYPAKPIRQWMRETAWLGRAVQKRDGRNDDKP